MKLSDPPQRKKHNANQVIPELDENLKDVDAIAEPDLDGLPDYEAHSKDISLLLHYQRLLTLFARKFKRLKRIDDAWNKWSTLWIADHKELTESWIVTFSRQKENSLSPLTPTPVLPETPTSPISLNEFLRESTVYTPRKQPIPPVVSREDILKQQITRLENARLGYLIIGEPIPDSISSALTLFGSQPPPRWLTDKEKTELNKYEEIINKSESNKEYRKLIRLVFDISTAGFDKAKFEKWLTGVAVTQAFTIIGTLISQLPFVPPGVGTLIQSFGNVYAKEQAVLPAFHDILNESASFLMILIAVNKSLTESEEYARQQQAKYHSPSKLLFGAATEDMRQLLDLSIEAYESKVREVEVKMQNWIHIGPVLRFFRQLRGRAPKLDRYVKDLQDIRVNVRDEVLLHVGTVSGRTLDAVHDGFKTIERLEEDKLRLTAEKILLESQRNGLMKEKNLLEAEKESLEHDKSRLYDDKKRLEVIKSGLLSEKKQIEDSLALLIGRSEGYIKLNTLHRDIGILAGVVRTALLRAGDKGLGLSGHLFHGAVIFNTAKESVTLAIRKIQELYELSISLRVPFEPVLFDHFNWKQTETIHAKFKHKDYPANIQWDLKFSDDLEWLYGQSGKEMWSIKVSGLDLDNSLFPAKFDP
ncbi:hypothetical protein HDU79_006631 [Rhizoclosmatium sp. JEL0117]|nr:hypothetical protein HDU79_006631 [Rhizoclosmatium sp. JEL0117]